MILHDKIAAQLPDWRARVTKLVKEQGEIVLDKVTIGQVYGGMRDIKSLVTDISFVDPATGIKFRGMAIPEVLEKLPKPDGATIPYVGGLFYLLLIGEVPTRAEAEAVEAEWARRADVPGYVYDMLRAMPKNTHPMVLLSQAVLALQGTSEYAKKYSQGIKKDVYWEPTLEDAMNLTAKLPVIAAFIYRLKYGDGKEDAFIDILANDYGCIREVCQRRPIGVRPECGMVNAEGARQRW